MKKIEKSPRINELRSYYLKYSKMSTDKNIACWKCHRSLKLYIEGWEKNAWNTDTARIRRSAAEAYMLEHTIPVIIPGELIVGQPCFDDFSETEQAEYEECLRKESMIPIKRGRADHLALDYQPLLDQGITGILEMCNSYAEKAKQLAEEASGIRKKEYLELYEVLKQVPAHPARTFREALQSIHMFTWSLYGIYSFGKPDLYLLPYYRRDIENGILTPDTAQELIDCFFLQSVPNMSSWAAEGLMLGGRDANGRLVENELTWHFLTAIEHTHLPDPNVGFCVTAETGNEILQYTAKLIADGHCQPQIWNSDEVTRSMLNNGFEPSAAYMFTLSTCVETTPIGCSGISITSPYINLLKIFLAAFEKCDNSFDFEQIYACFEAEVEKISVRS